MKSFKIVYDVKIIKNKSNSNYGRSIQVFKDGNLIGGGLINDDSTEEQIREYANYFIKKPEFSLNEL